MGLRPFVVTMSARLASWEGSWTLQVVHLVYADSFENAALRAAAQATTARPDIPQNLWQMHVAPEPYHGEVSV